jgi:hypothetical protein
MGALPAMHVVYAGVAPAQPGQTASGFTFHERLQRRIEKGIPAPNA